MTAFIQFKPKSQLSAKANLANLIVLSRDKIKLWNNLEGFNWGSPRWPTHACKIRFLKLEERDLHWTKDIEPHHIMTSPFIDFCKAYIRYLQQKKQTKIIYRSIKALQLLESALIDLEGQADVTKVSARILDRAVELMLETGIKDRQHISITLQQIAHDLGEWHIAVSNIKYWKHPYRGFESYEKISTRDPESSQKKLPHDETLLAIAEVFANGYNDVQDDEDIFITCVTTLLLSAPMRISEILHFRTSPLRTEKDALGNGQLFIAYWVPKNGKHVRKEIPQIMADHAREAVRRLREISEESRNLAKHFESDSDQFYRHAGCPDVPNDQELTLDQVVKALGVKRSTSAAIWVKKHTGSQSLKGWTLNSLWQLVLAEHRKLNPHFPYQVDPGSGTAGIPLKMSESLMCFRNRQLAGKQGTSPVLLAPIRGMFFANRVSQYGGKGVNNFFQKHCYNGLSLRSHQTRHFLNTLAQEAGVGIDAITEWSTRASKEQSRTYMHQTSEQKAQQIADNLNLTTSETLNPITEEEYQVMNHGPIITTLYGICVHDWTLTPCNKHADCLNCSDLLMCKGHQRSIAAIQEERDRIAENLAAAQSQIDSGKRVASRWYDAHSNMLVRLDELLGAMTNPEITDGSAIRMKGKDFSHESRILNKMEETLRLNSKDHSLRNAYSEEILECFKLLQEEKNG